jgi:tRNA-uridine 2-sulfurtransferase
MSNSIRAVALLSGGLDSMLAARIVQEQGIKVLGVHFATGFCAVQRRRRVARPTASNRRRLRNEALHSAAQLRVPVEIVDIADDYLAVVLEPAHGYGAHMNPCQDCRAFMLARARAHMEAVGAHFVVTGEVVGQRPNSQRRHLLRQIEREAGLEGLILRPLSAKLLDETVPEREGWVDRDRLYAIGGRGRKEQLRLAEEFGLDDFAQPAGGCCMLVEEAFARRLRDFLAHNPPQALSREAIALLSVGRHFRLPDGTKVIAGRDEGENRFLDGARRPDHWRLQTPDGRSPVALVKGPLEPEQVELAAAIVAGYSKQRREPVVAVEVDTGEAVERRDVAPLSPGVLWRMNVGADSSSAPAGAVRPV